MTLVLEDHVFRVLANQQRLSDLIGDHTWRFDMQAGLLTFISQSKRGRFPGFKKSSTLIAECPVQLIGTRSTITDTWLWAWANPGGNIPSRLLEGIERVKAEAQRQNMSLFLNEHEIPVPNENFGRELAIICTGYLDLFSYYACPYEGGMLYTMIERCPEAEKIPITPSKILMALNIGISALAFDHRRAVLSYLGPPTSQADDISTWNIESSIVNIRFDEQNRIADISATLKKPSG